MIEIVLANIFFWTVWASISYMPYLISEIVIENYDDFLEWKNKKS